jgi:hypothetical protein
MGERVTKGCRHSLPLDATPAARGLHLVLFFQQVPEHPALRERRSWRGPRILQAIFVQGGGCCAISSIHMSFPLAIGRIG